MFSIFSGQGNIKCLRGGKCNFFEFCVGIQTNITELKDAADRLG